jgi:dihydropteroate synthase
MLVNPNSGRVWQTTRFDLDLSRPCVMGIVNLTPDSFSDGGRWQGADAGRAHCDALQAQGADVLDLGAESSRPGAQAISAQEEWARLEPVLQHALTLGLPISVDTAKSEVMRRALDAGADIINDIRALQEPGALELAADHGRCGVCLMHMQGQPRTMQEYPVYPGGVMTEVSAFLRERAQAVMAAGVGAGRVVVDPGIGFGKSMDHNLELLARQRELCTLGFPVLVGWSRKSSLGMLTGRAVHEREASSLAAALAAVLGGASILRVHDVAAMRDALAVWTRVGVIGSRFRSVCAH